MKNIIFMSGATGFLGTEIALLLTRQNDTRIYVLVRADNDEHALHRLKANWHHLPELTDKIGSQIIPVIGDFTKKDLGLTPDQKTFLTENTNLIIHSGAEIGFQKGKKELYTVNCQGTKNMVLFAREVKNLNRFVHVSTAYVAGTKEGRIMEDSMGTSFSSLYEKSKAKAERIVQKSGLPYTICRPGMIVGHSEDGRIKNFNTIYYVLKLLLLGKYPLAPVSMKNHLNLVPVDYVAKNVVKASFTPEAKGKIFHLTCPTDKAPTSDELTDYVISWAKDQLGITIKKPVSVPMPFLKKFGLVYNKKTENRKKGSITNLLTLLPYFYADQEFDRTNTDAILGSYEIRWRDYIDALLDYACRKNFMMQTEHTVFEQAKIRRASKRFPVNYFDVSDDQITKVTGHEVNERIDRLYNALYNWGIRKGDRVALTGINSVDYMVLDQALGLLGAVTVPIYYTSPIEEASLLLQKSGSGWFFVGDVRIMEHIEALASQVHVVAFSKAMTMKNEHVMPMDEFMKKADTPAPKSYPDPDDLATIRYTSGTTGEPKGVMFNFGQLAWMGEVLTNLLPWKERNDYLRYLSFLPLSHVVEGILASYAPYYMLAKVDFYYLNDFPSLEAKLPKIKPTVFFSVPRFYEKVWNKLGENPVGKVYLTMPNGVLKKSLALLLKKVILKKAGLSNCSQLIVGSAPVSQALLESYRALGIEIYNAYGQTEAPLITINRLGDNVIPTIGTPLPETRVELTDDGELIVTGPQVAMGYYGLDTDTIRNGVLKTGDLGTLHENGHITLHGRKKEMIITAYGKNISIPKLEERLKNLSGVSEAVLIGENRPYCTALLWLDEENKNLAKDIELMNKDLSHPEQIRRFTVIDKPLSIQAGELTPNLKVKRKNVESHYQKEIEEMYR